MQTQAVVNDVGQARVVTYNVCGGYRLPEGCQWRGDDVAQWADAGATALREQSPDAVLLQELCKSQLDLLAARLPGYQRVWLQTREREDGCAKWGPGGTANPSGLGMLVRTSDTMRQYGHVFPAYRTVDATNPAADHYAILCADAPIDGRAVLLCDTHLDGTLKDQGAPPSSSA